MGRTPFGAEHCPRCGTPMGTKKPGVPGGHMTGAKLCRAKEAERELRVAGYAPCDSTFAAEVSMLGVEIRYAQVVDPNGIGSPRGPTMTCAFIPAYVTPLLNACYRTLQTKMGHTRPDCDALLTRALEKAARDPEFRDALITVAEFSATGKVGWAILDLLKVHNV